VYCRCATCGGCAEWRNCQKGKESRVQGRVRVMSDVLRDETCNVAARCRTIQVRCAGLGQPYGSTVRLEVTCHRSYQRPKGSHCARRDPYRTKGCCVGFPVQAVPVTPRRTTGNAQRRRAPMPEARTRGSYRCRSCSLHTSACIAMRVAVAYISSIAIVLFRPSHQIGRAAMARPLHT
jgi:hypothetical protein